MDAIENYDHLWTSSNGPWALLQLNPGAEEMPRYMVVNLSDRSVLVIEDDEVAETVKQRMLAAGAPIVWVGNGF